jgi:hypothetical protein
MTGCDSRLRQGSGQPESFLREVLGEESVETSLPVGVKPGSQGGGTEAAQGTIGELVLAGGESR